MPASQPSYLTLRMRRPGRWAFARLLLLVLVGAQAALLLERPALGLDVFWGLAVPLLPLVFMLAPSVWRNVCPMATANQLPRWLGLTLGRRLPGWLDRHGYGIGLLLFLGAVGSRPFVLEGSAGAVLVLLAAALALPLAGGLLFRGKSGFCGSICPLRPSQDLLSRAPAVKAGNAHCKPCVGCSSSCQDLKPATQLIESLHSPDTARGAYRRIFAAALPVVTVALFATPLDEARPELYAGGLVAGILCALGLLYVLESLTRATPGQTVGLFAAVSFGLFYWFNAPASAGVVAEMASAPVPAWVVWELRIGLALLALVWLVRTWRDSGARERGMTETANRVERRRAAPVQGAARPARATVEVGDPPIQIPDRRGPGRQMRAPVVTIWPRGVQVEVDAGTTLAAAARSAGIDVPEGCGTGLCGCDPVFVRSGAEGLLESGPDERATLERLAFPEGTRLACSAQVRGDVAIDLEPGDQKSDPAAPRVPAISVREEVERVVVVGNGVAGITAASQVRRLAPDAKVDLVTDSARPFYNRIAVTRLINDPDPRALELMSGAWYEQQRIRQWLSQPASGIDRARRELVLPGDRRLGYDRLILATGARSFFPDIPGTDLPGVFGIRTADDVVSLRSYVDEHGCRSAAVVGGGLLGVEAADALAKLGLRTMVFERASWLSAEELDDRAGELLADALTRRGIGVAVSSEVTRVLGDARAEGVALADGAAVRAELVVVCAGITPNVELARSAELECGRGVLVDDAMRTSDPNIYACGDVAEHPAGYTGRWPIAVEQAEVAATHALGGQRPYVPSPVPTRLKVSDLSLRVIGAKAAGPGQQEVVSESTGSGSYRKFVLDEGRLVGALVFGESPHWDALVAAVRDRDEANRVLRTLDRGERSAAPARLRRAS